MVLAFPLVLRQLVLWWWDYGHAQETDFVARTECTMPDKQIKDMRIFVRGVVAPYQDLARRFPAGVLLEGNSGQRVLFQVDADYDDTTLTADVPAARLKAGDRLTSARAQALFALAGWRPTKGEGWDEMATEFLSVLQGSGVGPKGEGPVSGKYFKGHTFIPEWHAQTP